MSAINMSLFHFIHIKSLVIVWTIIKKKIVDKLVSRMNRIHTPPDWLGRTCICSWYKKNVK